MTKIQAGAKSAAPINALIKTINQPLMALEALQAVATSRAAAPRIKK